VIVFLAGATGVIGRRLVRLLRADGHAVVGTTRSPAKVDLLRALGATPAVADVFDAAAIEDAVAAAKPDAVVHQLTDLPPVPDDDAAAIAARGERNARLRREGTRHLMAAVRAAGVSRVVAQSIAWAYAPGQGARVESDPLDVAAHGARAVTVGGVIALEQQVLGTPGVAGIVLRYGRLYGPDTWTETPSGPAPLHVDAAADAARRALAHGVSGIYNVAEEDGAVVCEKARRGLGFDANFRMN
jgi:nucleoside-diphosphate-sugar epimerase